MYGNFSRSFKEEKEKELSILYVALGGSKGVQEPWKIDLFHGSNQPFPFDEA